MLKKNFQKKSKTLKQRKKNFFVNFDVFIIILLLFAKNTLNIVPNYFLTKTNLALIKKNIQIFILV